ncbi:hypothetical protein [Burkholderia ubonensis]|uniref:hypothetical protein n=1 Tax=Burkholderia ubonensis TaxID=101571 RepID=UPI000757E177|nr:hypothetical protein [Burkholderia ubonensis]KUZ76920.1 hypothetical protein WI37_16210 [Burkholderia ubonensis]
MTGTDKKRIPQLLRVELTSPTEQTFTPDAPRSFGTDVQIEHPCDRFARDAGFTSWVAARTALLAGAIVTAPGPRIGKTRLEYDLFVKQIRLDGLVLVPPAHECFGLVSVGILERFPKAVQARATGAVKREEEGSD